MTALVVVLKVASAVAAAVVVVALLVDHRKVLEDAQVSDAYRRERGWFRK